jgi:formamidopyrimidine-DNA glycosylase
VPELPEVEYCRQILLRRRGALVDVALRDPAVVRPRLSTRPRDADPDGASALCALIGARTAAIDRHGKRIGWRFEGQNTALLLHLGMTGQWSLDVAPAARVVLTFDDGPVSFVDTRRFGSISVVPATEVDAALRDGHGPDGLLAPPDAATLRRALRGSRAVKVALLDQAVVAGLGNIHAVELLWKARVNPELACARLSDAQISAIAAEIPAHLAAAVAETAPERADDAPLRYVNQGGPNVFQVYDRADAPCTRCGAAIVVARHGGRSTYWCPSCQPA